MYKKPINIWKNVQTHKTCQLKQQIGCCTYNTGFYFFFLSTIHTDVDLHFFMGQTQWISYQGYLLQRVGALWPPFLSLFRQKHFLPMGKFNHSMVTHLTWVQWADPLLVLSYSIKKEAGTIFAQRFLSRTSWALHVLFAEMWNASFWEKNADRSLWDHIRVTACYFQQERGTYY